MAGDSQSYNSVENPDSKNGYEESDPEDREKFDEREKEI
jgi:hypothetical protein